MSTVALSGTDTIQINNTSLVDLADQNAVELTFPNDIANVKVGKNGNAIFSLNEMGNICDAVIRVIAGSAADKFLNNLQLQQQGNFPGFPLMQGAFVKQIGDGNGNIINISYIVSGGIFTKIPEAKSNAEGDTEQSVMIYRLKFASSPRVIGQ